MGTNNWDRILFSTMIFLSTTLMGSRGVAVPDDKALAFSGPVCERVLFQVRGDRIEKLNLDLAYHHEKVLELRTELNLSEDKREKKDPRFMAPFRRKGQNPVTLELQKKMAYHQEQIRKIQNLFQMLHQSVELSLALNQIKMNSISHAFAGQSVNEGLFQQLSARSELAMTQIRDALDVENGTLSGRVSYDDLAKGLSLVREIVKTLRGEVNQQSSQKHQKLLEDLKDFNKKSLITPAQRIYGFA